MKLELLRYTPDGEKLVASAAKLCYSPVGIDEIEEGQSDDKVSSFLKTLMDLGHESPIEHISFTFGIEGVSRTLTHQLVRHRLASYSQQSQRYVKLDQFEFIMPPNIEKNEKAKILFLKAMDEDQKTYDNIIIELIYDKIKTSGQYNHLCDLVAEYTQIDGGDGDWCIKTAYEDMQRGIDSSVLLGYIDIFKENYPKVYSVLEKESIEDARYVFPNACETKIVVTMNARSLIHFFSVRCCNRAQWEIQELATNMLKEVKKVYPILFSHAGPSCINGPCPEGKMTCGKITEVRGKFTNL